MTLTRYRITVENMTLDCYGERSVLGWIDFCMTYNKTISSVVKSEIKGD